MISKSEAIRQLLNQQPDLSNKEIMGKLKKNGVVVSFGLISNIKHYFMKSRSRELVPVRIEQIPYVPSPLMPEKRENIVDILKDLKAISERCGGKEELKQILEYIKL